MATYSRKRPLPIDAPLQPLSSISANTITSVCSSTTRSTTAHSLTSKKSRMTQLTLDLGQKVHTKCKTCSMDYILSSDEDRKLHKKFHDAFIEESTLGIPLTKATLERGRVVARFQPRNGRTLSSKSARPQETKKNGVKHLLVKAHPTQTLKNTLRSGRKSEDQHAAQDTVLEIRPHDHRTLKHLAQRVLAVVEAELGAVRIEDKELWSVLSHDDAEETRRLLKHESSQQDEDAPTAERQKLLVSERYRVYLYVHDGRAVGLLLAERIKEGRKVLPPPSVLERASTARLEADRHLFAISKSGNKTAAATVPQQASLLTPPPSSPPASSAADDDNNDDKTKHIAAATTSYSPLMASTTPSPASMGVSRIWVLSAFRAHGIANMLLETARRKMPYPAEAVDEREAVEEEHREEGGTAGLVVAGYEKTAVAFSQPTEMGRRFAERWAGTRDGWLVYD